MRKDQIQVEVGPCDTKRRRMVMAQHKSSDEELYRDTFNTDSDTSRRRFIKGVAKKTGLQPEELDWLHQEIPARADEVDQTADQLSGSSGVPSPDHFKRSTASQLVEFTAGVELFHCPDGDAYATYPVGDHMETASVASNAFRQWLSGQFYMTHESVPNSQALQDAVGLLEGQAIFDGETHEVHLRVASHGDSIIIDLCNDAWQVVQVERDGRKVLDESPVKFRRVKAMQPLPIPVPGKLKQLRHYLNINDNEWPLVAAWLVAALRPDRPFPVLCLHGEQGSAKSTMARVLRSLIDPNTSPVRAEPRNSHDLMVTAKNGWTIVLDNLSHLRTWLSDALCRLSTGGGFSTRKLYENDEEVIFQAMRPIILTGIAEVATRGDLIDRSLLVNLQAIPDASRVTEKKFWENFEQERPSLFGGLLTAVSTAMRRQPDVQLDNPPRMADFAEWAIAAEPECGLDVPFLDAYRSNRNSANELAMEASPLAKYVLALMENKNEWEGTATELLEELSGIASDQDLKLKSWPATPRKLSADISRLAPNLRETGIDVKRDRGSNRRSIRLTRTEPDVCVTSVMSVMDAGPVGLAGDSNDAVIRSCSTGENATPQCNHTDPAEWIHTDGKAHCPACNKYMGRISEGKG
jgi:hypothetical protein